MARQFDVVENRDRAGRSLYPFLLVLQHDHAEIIRSVIVAPIVRRSEAPTSRERLHLSVEIDGGQYVAIIEDLASIPRTQIGRVVGSSAERRYEITRALDMLFTGI